MNKNSKIYIAGHTGLIGRALMRELKKQGYKNLIFRTHRALDLTDRNRTAAFFKKAKPEYVFLAAGKVGGIGANTRYPAGFIYENTAISTNIIDLSYRYKVKKLLFLGCGCIYPRICPQPIREKYFLSGPVEPTSESYALAKITGIKMCQSYNRQYGTGFIAAVASNTYGPYDHFDDGGHVVSSLIKRFHRANIRGEKRVVIWGSGKPERDFIYADDTAKACIFLMKNYFSSEIVNIGSGRAVSIGELAAVIKETTGFKGKIAYDRTKPDGMPKKVLHTGKIRSLGWKPNTALSCGIKLTYDWYKTFPTITSS